MIVNTKNVLLCFWIIWVKTHPGLRYKHKKSNFEILTKIKKVFLRVKMHSFNNFFLKTGVKSSRNIVKIIWKILFLL